MPIRDVTIRLGLNAAPYVAGVKQAQAATGRLGADLTRTAAGGSKSAAVLGSSFGLVGLAAGAAGVKMISAAADFDEGMSMVKATGADAAKNIGALRQAALDAGAATKYSATEAAGGVEALAKAGVSSADVLGGGLKGALNLAAAGNLDVAGSAEAAASAMNQFGLAGKDVPHIADLLAAGAGKAQGEVSDMAAALNQAGLVANGFGYSIEETIGTLAEYASAGLVGSDAGTAMKTSLIRLAAPTASATAVLNKYGIATRDANGELLNSTRLAGELQRAFKGRSAAERDAALTTIFGQDALRGANILYKDGAEGAAKWAAAVDDAGFAAETAKTKMDNLKGDLETLRGSIDTLFISSGGGAQDPLRGLAKSVTDIINNLGTAKSKFDLLNGVGLDGPTPFERGRAFGISKETGVERKVVTKFQTIGADGSARKALAVAKAANLTPKEVRSVLKLLGWSPRKIETVAQALRQTQRQARIRATLQTYGFDPKVIDAVTNALESAKSEADVRAQLKLEGFDPAMIESIIGLLQDLGAAKPEPKVDADDKATPKLKGVQAMLAGLRDKSITVTTYTQTVPLKATGGPITGPGTGTSDDVPIMASNGEHMLTASDVNKAGGHSAIYRLRAAIQSGDVAFASGGAVGATAQQRELAIAQLMADMADNRSQLKTEKGLWPRRVLELEYREDKASLARLKAGLDDDPFAAVRDAFQSPVGAFDLGSESPWMGGGGISGRLQSRLAQMRTFAGKLQALAKAGLGGGLLAEVASLGSAHGIAAADELLKAPAEFKQLNAAYSGIQAQQGYVAAFANQAPAGIRLSFDGFSFDAKKSLASVRVVARDEAGRLIAQDKFDSVVHS